MDLHPPEISVTAPVELAIEHVKQVLFKPFEMAKWLAIGFCAWLAGSGGGGFHFNGGLPTNYQSNKLPGGKPTMPPQFAHFRDYLQNNLSWIIPLAIVMFVAFLVLVLVFSWLHSRGAFMLLHCVAVNRGEVAAPWSKFASEAWSLWLFRLCLGGMGLVLTLPFIGSLGWVFFEWAIHKQQPDAGAILAVLGIMALWMFCFLVIAIVGSLTTQFVVPIMYLKGGTCLDAWRVFLPLLGANAGRFILYLLFQVLIAIGIGTLVVIFVLFTLFIGALLLVIPFVGTVVMLPVIVFYRWYALYYLAQYGPEFDVFAAARPSPPPFPPLA